MLVYANQLFFRPASNADELVGIFANWLSRKVHVPIDRERMVEGIRSLRFRDQSMLTTTSTFVLGRSERFPFLFNASYAHNDAQVLGRRWTIEMGISQLHAAAAIECTIVMKTDERSVLVREHIEALCPDLLGLLLELELEPRTPGAMHDFLTPESTKWYLEEVTSVDRRLPVLLMSCDRDGAYLVPIEAIQPQVAGLCHIFLIPPGVDSYKLEQLVGRDRYTYNGAAKIIWPQRPHEAHGTCSSTLFMPAGSSMPGHPRYSDVSNPILAAITDHLNVPLSMRHISREKVSEQVVRSRLEHLQQTINADLPADDSELQVYQELLSSVDDEIRAKDQEASDLRDKAAALTAENSRLVALMTGYGHSTAKADVDSDLLRVRDAVLALYESKPTLTQGLELIQGLYHDRVEVLDSAFKSAEDSDAARFRYSEKATDLLLKLVTKYWEILAGGGSDQLAKDCFGAQTYSANEARLSSRGRSERTFFYRGEQVFMDKHLKIGGKDSLATTLRIHFEWFSDEKKIIIGHCGRHLTL